MGPKDRLQVVARAWETMMDRLVNYNGHYMTFRQMLDLLYPVDSAERTAFILKECR